MLVDIILNHLRSRLSTRVPFSHSQSRHQSVSHKANQTSGLNLLSSTTSHVILVTLIPRINETQFCRTPPRTRPCPCVYSQHEMALIHKDEGTHGTGASPRRLHDKCPRRSLETYYGKLAHCGRSENRVEM